MMPRMLIGETPFNLGFGTEAVISIKLGVLLVWVTNFDEEINFERWLTDLDLLDEDCERVYIRMATYR